MIYGTWETSFLSWILMKDSVETFPPTANWNEKLGRRRSTFSSLGGNFFLQAQRRPAKYEESKPQVAGFIWRALENVCFANMYHTCQACAVCSGEVTGSVWPCTLSSAVEFKCRRERGEMLALHIYVRISLHLTTVSISQMPIKYQLPKKLI